MQISGNSARKKDRFLKALQGVQYSIDLLTAALLLSGQITTSGVYVVPGGFFLAGTGPILGGDRMKGIAAPATIELDAIDVINALLLILGQVRVTGPYLTSGRVFIVWTGVFFGLEDTDVKDPFVEKRQMLRKYIKQQMLERLE